MSKYKTLMFGLFLALFIGSMIITPVHAGSLNVYTGPAGTSVTITINEIAAGQPFTLLWDGTNYLTGTVPTGGTILFTIPDAAGGSHTLSILSGSVTVFTTAFIILPTIAIAPTNGVTGTSVTITGKGFIASESSIQVLYDSTAITTGITAGTTGAWSANVTVPASTGGTHSFDASGVNTTAANVENKTFTVTPAISVTPTAGGVGTLITAKGSGFAASETAVKVTYDGKDVRTALSADTYGSWSTTFNIPASSSGAHIIDASGATTTATSITDISFTVAPGITVDKDSVVAGDSITVTGSGFGQYETNIYVTIDGIDKSSKVSADDSGQWTATLQITGIPGGTHVLDAHGASTAASVVVDKTISVQSRIILSPTGGNVGDTVTLTGTGFTSSKTAGLVFGAASLTSDIAVDAAGTISTTFKVPKGNSGQLKVTVTDSNNIAATATFAVETTPPAQPKILSPGKDESAGFIGDARVDFKWSDVTDPSGVSYDIQVASDPNFNAIKFQYSGLTTAEYKSKETEVLTHGEYYWRVRAVDGAGNATEWTAATPFKAGLISTTTFIIIIVVLVVVLLIYLRARAVFKKH